MKTLSNNIIGCKSCLGEWIEAKYLRNFIKNLRELILTNATPYKKLKELDKLVGKKLK